MNINKFNVYLVIIIVVSAGFYTGSILTGYVHKKFDIDAVHNDTIVGEFTTWAGKGMNSEVIFTIFVSTGTLYFLVFEDGLWSKAAISTIGEVYVWLYAVEKNNITLTYENVNSYIITIQSFYCNFTIEITILREILGPGLAISGVISIILITIWLIKRKQIIL